MTLPDHYDEEEEVRFIKEESLWPFWPVLPVKKVGDPDRPCAIVIAGRFSTVILMNLFELSTGPLGEQIKDREKIKYESVEAMVHDGWIGD